MDLTQLIDKFNDWHEPKEDDSNIMGTFKISLSFFYAWLFFTIAAFIIAFLVYFVWPHIASFLKLLFNL
jgi:hypothetical protein